MNERIQELAEQAGASRRAGVGGLVFRDAELEKFAELVVRECAKKGFDIFDEEPDAPASDLQFYVRDRILQHFGVEE
jgi:hypothetical protein